MARSGKPFSMGASTTAYLTPPAPPGTYKGPLDRFLSIFTDVRQGEGIGVMLLALNVFILLGSYYLLKTARESLVLSEGGAEVKSYAAGRATGSPYSETSCYAKARINSLIFGTPMPVTKSWPNPAWKAPLLPDWTSRKLGVPISG